MFERDQEIVNELVTDNQVFRQLYDTHHDLKEKIHSAEMGVHPMEDLALGTLKKEKLQAKDQMATMIEEYRREHSSA